MSYNSIMRELGVRLDERAVKGKKVLIALSGGADSVCLMHLLAQKRDEYGMRLCAAHYHHGIRGDDADGDLEFCRTQAEMEGIPFYSERGDVPRYAREHGLGLESAAREMRYDFLERTRRSTGCDVIALAHHADDNAETVLMHILRGTGLKGLRGMPAVSGTLVRPLLGCGKKDILAYLERNGYSWREDATNRESDNPRNILRLEAMPALERAYPGCRDSLNRLALACAADDAFLDRLTDGYMRSAHVRGPYGDRLDISACPDEAILMRAVRRCVGAEVYYDSLMRVLDICRGEGVSVTVAKDIEARAEKGRLYLLRPFIPPREVPLELNGVTVLPGICTVEAAPAPNVPVRNDPFTQVLDPDALRGAVLRTRRAGDRMHPLGMTGSQSLGDRMTDRKIPLCERDTLPLIAVGSEVIWAPGCGISHTARITETTGKSVKLYINTEGDTHAQ